MNYNAMGACEGIGCGTGWAQPSYPGYGYPYQAPAYPLATYPAGASIIGADPAPAPATPGVWDKTKTFLGEPSLGVKNGYWLGGAAALGLIYYGHTQDWFGTASHRDYGRRR